MWEKQGGVEDFLIYPVLPFKTVHQTSRGGSAKTEEILRKILQEPSVKQ